MVKALREIAYVVWILVLTVSPFAALFLGRTLFPSHEILVFMLSLFMMIWWFSTILEYLRTHMYRD